MEEDWNLRYDRGGDGGAIGRVKLERDLELEGFLTRRVEINFAGATSSRKSRDEPQLAKIRSLGTHKLGAQNTPFLIVNTKH